MFPSSDCKDSRIVSEIVTDIVSTNHVIKYWFSLKISAVM